MNPELLVVFDTNVLVSTVMVPNGVPQQALLKAIQGGQVVQSLATLDELRSVLERPKFDKYISRDERTRFLTSLVRESVLVIIHETVTACRDPKDDKFLELAVNASADMIVTGDEDLLVLHPFRGISILRPADFLNREW